MKSIFKKFLVASFALILTLAVSISVIGADKVVTKASTPDIKVIGASVYVGEEVEGKDKSGIRFKVVATDNIVSNSVELGVLLLPADMTDSTEVLVNTATEVEKLVIPANKWTDSAEEGYEDGYKETIVHLFNFTADAYNRDILCNAYYIAEENGTPTYAGTITRSMAQVASEQTTVDASKYILDYAVNFYGADGETEVSGLESVEVKYGSTYDKPQDPTEEGKKFLGWVDGNENDVVFPITVKGVTNIYSKWEDLMQVTGIVTVPSDDTNLTVVITDANGDTVYKTSEVVDGVVTINTYLEKGTYTVRALGYTETETITAEDTTVNLAPKTYEFAAMTSADGSSIVSASYTSNNNTLVAANGTVRDNWYRGTTANGDYIQMGGNSYAMYYEGFSETEYAFGAVGYTFYGFGGSVSLGNAYSSRNMGLSIATAHDQMHIVINESSIWVEFGQLNHANSGSTAYKSGNGIVKIKSATDKVGFWTLNNDSKVNRTSLGGYSMALVRQNGVLTFYVHGVKYLTLDATNGVTAYEHLANATITKDGTVSTDDALLSRIAHFVKEDMPNKVGYIGLGKTIDSAAGSNTAVFSDYYRTTDLSSQSYIDSFPANLVVNGTAVTAKTVQQVSGTTSIGTSASGTWLYNRQTGELVNNAGKSGYTDNMVFIGNEMTGSYELSAILDSTAKNHNGTAYAQVGFAITDGTYKVIICFQGTSFAITLGGDRVISSWSYKDANGNPVFGSAGSTIKKVRLVKDAVNGKIDFFVADIVNGVVGTEYHALEITATTITAKSSTESFAHTSATKTAFASILSKSNLVGFGNMVGGNANDYPVQKYSDISLIAK